MKLYIYDLRLLQEENLIEVYYKLGAFKYFKLNNQKRQ